jgi:hypothetical protein
MPTIMLSKEIHERLLAYQSYRVYCLTREVPFNECIKELLDCWERNEKPEALKK